MLSLTLGKRFKLEDLPQKASKTFWFSIMHLIPQDCKYFYTNLHGQEGLEDDVDGFSGSPDFEVEEEH